MSMANRMIDTHPRLIIGSLVGFLAFFAVSCTFNAAIPVCHWLFRCDHWYHDGESVSAAIAATAVLFPL